MFQIFITDLDGTLLDHHTYDYSPAWPALHRLKKEHAPLILSTSKTAAEIIPFRLEIDNHDPFIVENGGGIFIPEGYFSSIELETREVGRFLVISHAPAYTQLQESLAQLAERHNVKVESFAEMTNATGRRAPNRSGGCDEYRPQPRRIPPSDQNDVVFDLVEDVACCTRPKPPTLRAARCVCLISDGNRAAVRDQALEPDGLSTQHLPEYLTEFVGVGARIPRPR